MGERNFATNKLKYLQPLSGRKRGIWIGYCKGDKVHDEHLVVIKKLPRWHIINTLTDTFTKPSGKNFSNRLFERVESIACSEGQSEMMFQKTLTNQLNMSNVDVYRCKGNRIGKGHKPHLTRIHHGMLEIEINKKSVGVLIIIIESD